MTTKQRLLEYALMQCYNHLNVYRAIENYCISQLPIGADSAAVFHAADPNTIEGNLATCVLIDCSKMEIVSNTLISPSFMNSHAVRQHQREKGLAGNPLPCRIASKVHMGGQEDEDEICDSRKVWVNHGEQMQFADLFEEGIPSDSAFRSSDSEHVLINVIDAVVSAKTVTDDLLVVLATERVPCASCTRTMLRLLERHPKICLSVAYTFDTKSCSDSEARQASDLISQVDSNPVSQRMQLQRILVNGKILECFPSELKFAPSILA